jgi:hypothetical protein
MATVYQGPSTIVGNYNPAFNVPQSSDLNALRPIEVSQLFGQNYAAGDRGINSLIAPLLVGDRMRIDSTATIGISLQVPLITSTTGQPIVIHSGSGVVDFGGATIINTSISGDPNAYMLVGTVTTVDTTPTVGLVIPTGAYAYTFDVEITAISGTDYGSIMLRGGGKGSPTATTPFLSRKRLATAGLNAIDAYFAVLGGDIVVYVVGMPLTTVRWRVRNDVVRVQ